MHEYPDPKTGVRKRIDPKLAHQIQGLVCIDCIGRENVYTGAGCPVIGQPCIHWPKDLPHKTAPLAPPSETEMAPCPIYWEKQRRSR